MKLWIGIFIILAITSNIMFFGLILHSINELHDPDIPEVAVLGKQVWEREGCVECHTLFGNGGYHAPDLTHEITYRGEDWLWDFFLTPKPMRPHQRRKHLSLNWDDTEAIIEYLRYVDGISVLGWPPKPLFQKETQANK